MPIVEPTDTPQAANSQPDRPQPVETNAAEASPKPAAKKGSGRVKYLDAPGIDATQVVEGKLTGVPSDYDSSKMLPPGKKDFAEEANYWDFQALLARERVTKCEKEAKTCRETGSKEQRKALAQRDKLRAKMAEVEAFLSAEGIDPAALEAATS